jgi:hypothetical protein
LRQVAGALVTALHGDVFLKPERPRLPLPQSMLNIRFTDTRWRTQFMARDQGQLQPRTQGHALITVAL